MLGPDVVVSEAERLAEGQIENILGPRREGDVARRRRLASADDPLHLVDGCIERDVQRLERFGGNTLALVDESEQEVLGPDELWLSAPASSWARTMTRRAPSVNRSKIRLFSVGC